MRFTEEKIWEKIDFEVKFQIKVNWGQISNFQRGTKQYENYLIKMTL